MEEKEFDYFFHKHPNETSFQSLIYVGEKRRWEALDSVGLCQFSCSAQELKRKMIKLIRQSSIEIHKWIDVIFLALLNWKTSADKKIIIKGQYYCCGCVRLSDANLKKIVFLNIAKKLSLVYPVWFCAIPHERWSKWNNCDDFFSFFFSPEQ